VEYDAVVYEREEAIRHHPFSAASDEEAEEKMQDVTPFYVSAKTVILWRQDGENWIHVSSWRYTPKSYT